MRGDWIREKLSVLLQKTTLSMDLGRPIANAVAVAGRNVVSLGDLERPKPSVDRYPHEVHDRFADKAFCPGFIDPHNYLRLSGIYMGLENVYAIDSTDPAGRKGRRNR